MKQWFYYLLLRAWKLYKDDHYQTATKNVLPFIRNSELCMCYKILFWSAIFQRFFPSSALGPVLRASHIAQEPTGSFPRPSFLPPWVNRVQSGSFTFASVFVFDFVWEGVPICFCSFANSFVQGTVFKTQYCWRWGIYYGFKWIVGNDKVDAVEQCHDEWRQTQFIVIETQQYSVHMLVTCC